MTGPTRSPTRRAYVEGVGCGDGPEGTAPRRGRPRSAHVEEAVRQAVVSLLENVGYNGLRVDDVAELASVSKTTIYRRWPTKAALVVDVLATLKATRVPMPTTGNFEEDLRSIIYDQFDSLAASSIGRALPGLIAEKISDPALSDALEGLWTARRRLVAAVLRRGIRSGELRPDLDVTAVVDLLAATAYYRLLLTGQPLDRRSAKRHADALLTLISPR